MSYSFYRRRYGYRRRRPTGPAPGAQKQKYQDCTKFGLPAELNTFLLNYTDSDTFMKSFQEQLAKYGLTEKQWKIVENKLAHHKAKTNPLKTPLPTMQVANIPIFINRTAAFREIRDPYKLPYGIFSLKIKSISNAGKARNGNIYAEIEVEADADSPVNACRICGKTLRDHKSVVSGIGPDCAKKLGALYITYKQDVQKFVNDFKIEAAKVGIMKIKIWNFQIKENSSEFIKICNMFWAQPSNVKSRISAIAKQVPNKGQPVTAISANDIITTYLWDPTADPMKADVIVPNYYFLPVKALDFFDNDNQFYIRNIETNNRVFF